MKVYLLIMDRGFWDSHVNYPIGIYDSLTKAEEARLKRLIEINELKKDAPIEPDEDLLFQDVDLYESLYQKYSDWLISNIDISDVNDIYIREFELNTILPVKHT